jgi:hypothetical protein
MRSRFLEATLGLLVAASGLTGQTLPEPTLPPTEAAPSPETPPDGLALPVRAVDGRPLMRPQRWEYALGVGGRWDSNIEFLDAGVRSSAAVVPRGSLARVFWRPRGQLRLRAAGRWIGYADREEQGRGYADFGLDARYRLSPSTTWEANASYTIGHSDSSQPLLDQGVLLPLVKTRTLTGALGVSRQLGARTALRVGGRIYRTEFDEQSLVDGESVRGTLAIERRLGSRSTAALVYSLEDVLSDPQGRSYLTHFGSLQWTRVLSPRAAVLFEGGASYTPGAARATLERRESFFGGAGLSLQLKRSNLTAFVRREVVPAFGAGVSRLETRTGLNAFIPIGRDWWVRAAATHVQPDATTGVARVYGPADDASVVLGWSLGGRLELTSEAAYRRRGATSALPSIEAFQVGVFLNLLSASTRRSRAARPEDRPNL